MKAHSKNLYKALLQRIAFADRDVERVLKAWLADRKPKTKRERVERVAEVKSILAALDVEVKKEAPRIVSIAYDKNRRAALKSPGLELFPEISNFGKLHRDSVNLIADNMVNALGEASQTLGRRTEDAFRRHGLRTSAEQLAREQPTAVAAGRLERRLRNDGLTSFVDRAGRRWRLASYAKMVIVTTTAEAQNQAVVNAMLSRGADLVDVKHTNPGHDEDDVCLEYDGKTFSLTGRTPGYAHLDRIPPFHPNCDHFLMPSRAGLADLGKAA